jgi:hypothetical protein
MEYESVILEARVGIEANGSTDSIDLIGLNIH